MTERQWARNGLVKKVLNWTSALSADIWLWDLQLQATLTLYFFNLNTLFRALLITFQPYRLYCDFPGIIRQ
jgi:hypothetical protein